MTAQNGLATTKAHALRSFDVADFPALSGREEEWRFTPLKRLRGLATLDIPAISTGVATVDGSAAEGSPLVIGYERLPAGITVSTVDQADRVLVPFDRISALAYGAAKQVTLVEVDPESGRGAKAGGGVSAPAEPAYLTVTGGGAGGYSFARTQIRTGAFAKAVVIVEQRGSVTLADNVEVVVGDGAQLTLVTVANWNPDAVQAQHVRFRLGRAARVVHVQVALGGNLVRQFTSVEYTDRGGDADLYGLYFADAAQHLEHRLLVDHSVPDCRSYVGYRGALQGESAHTVWVGDVLIRNQATGTDTYEINRNLVLSDGARADSVPNLEIETGEVVGAGHASATGRFDDEQLFYLMSRGIPATEARKLVVRGFFAELLAKIPEESLRERLTEAIEARLAKVEG